MNWLTGAEQRLVKGYGQELINGDEEYIPSPMSYLRLEGRAGAAVFNGLVRPFHESLNRLTAIEEHAMVLITDHQRRYMI